MNSRILITIFLASIFLSSVVTSHASDDLESRRNAKLEATVMNPNLPLDKRIRALQKMQTDEMVDGRILRTFCVWDPLGKTGPISSTVEDQKLRSLHYGMDLTVITYQDESKLLEALRSGETCDAALIRGIAAMEFNRFAGTIESVGGLQSTQQLQLLMQVIANPRMAPRLQDDNYTVLGVATIGETYRFSGDSSNRSLANSSGSAIATDLLDSGAAALAQGVGARSVGGEMMANVQSYADRKVTGMISPIIAYLVMGNGQISGDLAIMKTPIAQSTIQLIGRTDKFPPGLAQILREDFLFKFESYSRRVKNELALISSSAWAEDTPQDVATLEAESLKVRLKLRDEGFYDATMLKLQRKIRCKFEHSRGECMNSLE